MSHHLLDKPEPPHLHPATETWPQAPFPGTYCFSLWLLTHHYRCCQSHSFPSSNANSHSTSPPGMPRNPVLWPDFFTVSILTVFGYTLSFSFFFQIVPFTKQKLSKKVLKERMPFMILFLCQVIIYIFLEIGKLGY